MKAWEVSDGFDSTFVDEYSDIELVSTEYKRRSVAIGQPLTCCIVKEVEISDIPLNERRYVEGLRSIRAAQRQRAREGKE